MKITIVIPCYRSEKTLPIVVKRIKETVSKEEGYQYQIILVNDCAPDNTFGVIKELCAEDKNIIGVNLTRNWGQAHARMAGIPFIEGDIAVFMDDDGQHPIERMFELIHKVEEGYDLVSANFQKQQAKWTKRVTSKIASKIYIMMGKRPEGAVSSSYFAINKMCITNLKNYKSPFPSIFGYLYQIAGRITNIKFEHLKRMSGKSGYNFKKRFTVWLNGFVNFSIVPLRISAVLGTLSAFLGFLLGIGLIIYKIVNPEVLVGYTSLISVILFIGGLLMVMLGLIGEYIGRMYLVLSNQPQYIIRETINT